jgi:hypothetical protein
MLRKKRGVFPQNVVSYPSDGLPAIAETPECDGKDARVEEDSKYRTVPYRVVVVVVVDHNLTCYYLYPATMSM